MTWPTYHPLGDEGVLVSYENRIDPIINKKAMLFAEVVERQSFSWLKDILFSYRSLLVVYDPHRIRYPEAVAAIQRIEKILLLDQTVPAILYEIPTVYGEPYGADLPRVARVTGLPSEEVIRIFSSTVFTIYFLGFLCAQPYLGGLPDYLQVPRLDTPRILVPAGSVGIGGIQAGVITIDQPSGYNYIGRSFLSLYDPTITPPTLLKAGDQVVFTHIPESEIPMFRGKRPVLREKGNGCDDEGIQNL